MSRFEVRRGDALDVLPLLPSASFDAVLSDPPYGIGFLGKDWDAALPSPEVWRECLRVLRPGGHAVVFGATRMFHRLAVSVEEAGFELRDTIAWLQGSGYPKNGDLGKATAKRAPGSGASKVAEGLSTALKPGWEPALVFRKPLNGRTLDLNVRLYGTGALNVEAGKLGNGRWPPNVALDEAAAEGLDARSNPVPASSGGTYKGALGYGGSSPVAPIPYRDLAGVSGASGFFFASKARALDERDRGLPEGETNDHPTLKPLALTEWLAKLLLPPATRERRILVPFSGSGSEAIGCGLAGWESVVGIERDPKYARWSELRFKAWCGE